MTKKEIEFFKTKKVELARMKRERQTYRERHRDRQWKRTKMGFFFLCYLIISFSLIINEFLNILLNMLKLGNLKILLYV